MYLSQHLRKYKWRTYESRPYRRRHKAKEDLSPNFTYSLSSLFGADSVTIKVPNWRYYSNITNFIYRGSREVVRENVYLYDVQV
jgi:hypothetical protein